MKLEKIFIILSVGFYTLLMLSCSDRQNTIQMHCQKKEINVQDCLSATFLDTTQYSIELFSSLSLPSHYKNLKCDKVEFVNGYFYLLDTEFNCTILVFDSIGNYVSHIGQRGRASNEYIDKPTDFCVNKQNNQIMVYERNAHRIHTYDLNGKQTSLQTLKMWPYDVGTLFNGYYVAAFDYKEAGNGLQLSVIDKFENIVAPILRLDESFFLINNERVFKLSEDNLYHIPAFSDSVLVFNSDTLSNVIHLNFQSQFITPEIIKETKKENLNNYKKFEGITSISDYYETKFFINFSYSKSQLQLRCIIDKRNGIQYHFAGSPFKGLFPGYMYTVVGEYMYWLITQDDIADLNYAIGNEFVEKELSQTSSLIRDIINEKYSLPIIVKIKLKQ